MTETYQIGESVKISATITDTDGASATPTSVVISIKKPDGTVAITDAVMSTDVAGSYYYDYTIADDTRVYRVAIKATGAGGRVTIELSRFVVEEPI